MLHSNTSKHIPRAKNVVVDKLAKAAAQNQPLPPDVYFLNQQNSLKKRAEGENGECHRTMSLESPNHGAPIMAYLRDHFEPSDELELHRLKQRARGCSIVGGELYKSRVSKPWLRCITSEKRKELLKEIHSGFSGAHIGTRALSGKAIKQGFF
jgi:hypothetical protein